ncbi:unnamed protein product [Ilex paraguariensis]|uniref:Uncharacterized protein n=1 Tax=Ilex paraguariensis TaxID=185542 RepID=A0ABC8UX34_9AQUA
MTTAETEDDVEEENLPIQPSCTSLVSPLLLAPSLLSNQLLPDLNLPPTPSLELAPPAPLLAEYFVHQVRNHLKDLFNTTVLHDTIVQILDTFMSMGNPHHWVDYLMPQDARVQDLIASSGSDSTDLSHATKFDLLMAETRAVLSRYCCFLADSTIEKYEDQIKGASLVAYWLQMWVRATDIEFEVCAEFGNIVDMTLKTVVDALVEDIEVQSEGSLSSGMPLAKLLPRIAQMAPLLLEEPSRNRFIQIIRNIQEVELFFTLLYANAPIG